MRGSILQHYDMQEMIQQTQGAPQSFVRADHCSRYQYLYLASGPVVLRCLDPRLRWVFPSSFPRLQRYASRSCPFRRKARASSPAREMCGEVWETQTALLSSTLTLIDGILQIQERKHSACRRGVFSVKAGYRRFINAHAP